MAHKILLAVDESSMREPICTVFQKQYEVVCAKNGAEVFTQFNRTLWPDIVLLNYLLPDETGRPPAEIGLTLLHFIKQKSPRTTVILVNGRESAEVAFQAGRLGAFAYVQKPFDAKKLAGLLKAAVKQRKSLRNPKSPSQTVISGIRPLSSVKQAERDIIVQMLRETDGNKFEAAKKIGIGRQTLYNKIKAYGIET